MSNFYVELPNAAASSNPSVGTNTQTAPGSSTEIGTIDGSGKLQGVSSTNPLPITAPSLPLPSNAAIETGGNLAAINTATGAKADSAATDSTSSWSVIAMLKGLFSKLVTINTTLGSPFQAGGNIGNTAFNSDIRVGSSAVSTSNPVPVGPPLSGALPVSGTVTANAGTNLNTSLLALESGGNIAGINTATGAKTDSAATDSTSSWSVIALLKGLWAKLNTINTTLGSPFQAGGSIGNTTFASTQSGTWTVQPGNTANTTAWKVDGSAVTQPVSASSLPLPTGAATSALQSTISGQLPASLGAKTTANSFAVNIASDQTVPVKQGGKAPVAQLFLNMASTNVTTSAYVQLTASIGGTAATMVEVFSGTGEVILFGVGGAGSEVVQFNIIPGGNGQVPLAVAASSRIAVKSLTNNVTAGYLVVNLYA